MAQKPKGRGQGQKGNGPEPPREIVKRGGRTPYLEVCDPGVHMGLTTLVKVPKGVATAVWRKVGESKYQGIWSNQVYRLALRIAEHKVLPLRDVLLGAAMYKSIQTAIAVAEGSTHPKLAHLSPVKKYKMALQMLGGRAGERWFLGWAEHWRWLRGYSSRK